MAMPWSGSKAIYRIHVNVHVLDPHFLRPYLLVTAYLKAQSLPLLFAEYMNDLPNSVANCNVESYVDDTKLYIYMYIYILCTVKPWR